MDIEINEAIIWVGKNYLGDVARAAWKTFKIKFPDEITRIAAKGNNILNFCYTIYMLLTVRDANIGLDLRQKETMRDLEQL